MGNPPSLSFDSVYLHVRLRKKLLVGTTQTHVLFWRRRCVDAMLCVSDGPDSALQQLSATLNSFHTPLQFTLEEADYYINFLDIIMTLNNTHNHLTPSFAIFGLHFTQKKG